MRHHVFFIALALAFTAVSAHASTLTNPASGATCTDGQDVRITKDHFSVVLEGRCGAVTITASDGSLNVSEARSLHVRGSGVTVLNEKVDVLSVDGDRNTLNMTEVGEARVGGNGNLLLGTDYQRVHFRGKHNTVNTNNEPQLEDEGSGNRVI